MPLKYLSYVAWQWIQQTGLQLGMLIVACFLVPRIGRLIIRLLSHRLDADEEESKTKLALIGTGVYIAQLIAYFFLVVLILSSLGFSLAGATIPATIVSATVGLGAQSIVADFLAGFFILSEKQYGIGDWVTFKGNGIEVEGDVIQITMRATRVRTQNGDTVTIPNSTAKVSINASNAWARAVVIMPVPLLGSKDINQAINRAETAARSALARPDIRVDITGELQVHPAVSVESPTTVGMPWIMNIRFIVESNPARQWAVERAIRVAILDEFWDEYGSAPTITGEVQNTLAPAGGGKHHQPAQTSLAAADLPTTQLPQQHLPSTKVLPADPEHRPAKQATAANASQGTDPGSAIKNQVEDQLSKLEQLKNGTTWQRLTSLGGRVRPSTTGLIALLVVLGIGKAFTVQASDEYQERFSPTPTFATTSSVPAPSTTAAPSATAATTTSSTDLDPSSTARATSAAAATSSVAQPQGTPISATTSSSSSSRVEREERSVDLLRENQEPTPSEAAASSPAAPTATADASAASTPNP